VARDSKHVQHSIHIRGPIQTYSHINVLIAASHSEGSMSAQNT